MSSPWAAASIALDLANNFEIIQNFYDEMMDKGLSARTVRYTHSLLSSAMRSAAQSGKVFRNPCSLCILPRKSTPEMKYFTAPEAKQFLAAAKSDKLYPLFLLAIETGPRPNEYLGLQWKDIDLDSASLSVRRAVKIRAGGGYYFTEPKTKGARRRIQLSQTLAAALKTHRHEQLQIMMRRRQVYQDVGLVFANEVGLPLLLENIRNRHFNKIIEAARVPKIRLYDLRHTTATLLLSAGKYPKVVSERLRHGSTMLTRDTYSHGLAEHAARRN